MILLRTTITEYEELKTGSFEFLLSELERMTEEKEQKGEFLVSDEKIGERTIMRDFATKKGGLCDTLIICDGVASSISLPND